MKGTKRNWPIHPFTLEFYNLFTALDVIDELSLNPGNEDTERVC